MHPSVAWPVPSTTDPLPPLLWAEMSHVELSSCPVTPKSGENPTQTQSDPSLPNSGDSTGPLTLDFVPVASFSPH